jgi:hypothetical protein
MMKTNHLRLSEKLDNYLEEFRDKARAESCPTEIFSAMQRLSEMPKYMEIDVEGLIQKAIEERQNNKKLYERLAPIDPVELALKESQKWIIDTLSRYKLDTFLTARGNVIESFLEDILKEIQEILERTQEVIDRSREESESWREKTANVNRQLRELEDKYSTLQQDYETRVFSYMCRDYQSILEQIGSHPSGKTEQLIKRMIEEALKEINVDVLWEQLETSNGKYFLIQNDSEATNSGVVRPCLVKKSDVLHKGVILNPISGKE